MTDTTVSDPLHDPAVGLDRAVAFVRAAGLHLKEVSGSRLVGHLDLGPDLRSTTPGRAEVVAEPLQQGRGQQLRQVPVTGADGRALARGCLRLQVVPLPGAGA